MPRGRCCSEVRAGPGPVGPGGPGWGGEKKGRVGVVGAGWKRGASGGGGPVGAVSPVGASVTGRQRRGSRFAIMWVRPRPRGGRRRGGWRCCGLAPSSPTHLARLHPVQVPSASRRGGLKTLGGSPVRLGSGAVGPVGSRGGWSSRVSSRLRCPPPAAPQAGVPPRLRPRHGPPRLPGGGLPGGCRVVRERVRVRAPRVPWGCVWGEGTGGNPLGACGVVPSSPRASAWRGGLAGLALSFQPFRPLGVWSLLSLAGRPEAPFGDVLCQVGGAPLFGVGPPGDHKNSYDS